MQGSLSKSLWCGDGISLGWAPVHELNEAPAFGELEDSIYAACCQNGLGAARGTLMGMYAAELVAGLSSHGLDLLLAEGVPKKLPPAPFDRLGAIG